MNVEEFYQRCFQTEDDLTTMWVEGRQPAGSLPLGPVKLNPRIGKKVPTVEGIYLCSADHIATVHPEGRPGAVVLANLKNAAASLNEFGGPWRLATAQEIAGYKDLQARNFVERQAADAKADRSKPFQVNVPGLGA